MKHEKLSCMTEVAIMAALSMILSLIVLFRLPQGGSVTAGCMVPILVVALRRGWKWGVATGVIAGALQLLAAGGVVYHYMSVLLDYLLPCGVIGLAGLYRGSMQKALVGSTIAISLRFLCHYLSGVWLFASYAPEGQSPYLYSLLYNGSYMLVELGIALVLIVVLMKAAPRLFAVR